MTVEFIPWVICLASLLNAPANFTAPIMEPPVILLFSVYLKSAKQLVMVKIRIRPIAQNFFIENPLDNLERIINDGKEAVSGFVLRQDSLSPTNPAATLARHT